MARRRRLEVLRSAAGSVLPGALILLLAAAPARAQRAFEVGGRYVLSHMQGENDYAGGDLDVDSSQGFEASGELFFSPRVSTRLSLLFLQPVAIAYTPQETDLGTIGIQPVTLTARWHVAPPWRLGGYAGAGAALVILGNIDDRFGDAVEGDFERPVTWVAEAGVRWRYRPNVYLEAGAEYLPIDAGLRVRKTNIALPARLKLTPVLVTMGVNWRF